MVEDDEVTVKTSNCSAKQWHTNKLITKPKGNFLEYVNIRKQHQSRNEGWREISSTKTIPPPQQEYPTARSTENAFPQNNKNLPRKIFPATSVTTHHVHHEGGQSYRPSKSMPASSPPATNITTKAQAWITIIQQKGIQNLANSSLLLNHQRISNIVHAISDSGATAHFIVKGAPVTNLKKATFPLRITLPNGGIIYSTRTCNLDIPWLPKEITEAHIVPGIERSLIATRKFCDAGCQVIFDQEECRIYYNNRLVLTRERDKADTSLWKLPVNPKKTPKCLTT